MRIGIDARMFRSSIAGIGRYSQNLVKNLLEIDHENRYILFMTSEDAEEYQKLKIKNQNVVIKTIDIPHYSIAEQMKLPKILASEKCDLIHFLNFNYPVQYKGKFIVTIHDLTLFFYPQTARQTNFIKRFAYKLVMNKACQNSEKIIAVSESTKKDIVEKFKVKSEKVKVIYEAADDKSFEVVDPDIITRLKSRYTIGDKPVILYVGQWRPHKNIVGLIKAFTSLKKDVPKAVLVLLGKPDPKHQAVQETIDKSGFSGDIKMPGFVSNEELAAWYKIASVFCFPSFYEGFGLPGLEAMMAGTPVISSDKTSLPEIFQDAALYFDPLNISEIADKIKLVINDKELREELIEKGRIQAQKYSWKKTASDTLKVYEEVIHSHS